MSNFNSLSPFTGAGLKELLEAARVTQFISGTNFFHILSGLIMQGGFVTTHSSGNTVNFNAAFPKQTLVVIVQPANSAPTNFYVDTVTLQSFDISHGGGGTHDYYWLAIGV